MGFLVFFFHARIVILIEERATGLVRLKSKSHTFNHLRGHSCALILLLEAKNGPHRCEPLTN